MLIIQPKSVLLENSHMNKSKMSYLILLVSYKNAMLGLVCKNTQREFVLP